MTLTSTPSLSGYDAARESVVVFPQPGAGYLRVGGADRMAFLQRQTTNDLRLMAPRRALETVLTSPTARVLDVLLLLTEPEAIGVITLPGRGPATTRYLRGKIFFMDKVTVDDASSEFAQFDLEGPNAARLLHEVELAQPPALDEVVSGNIDGVPVHAIGRRGLVRMGYRLLAPAASGEALAAALTSAGAIPLTAESYQVLRVEAGLPGPTRELTEEYNPLEANLEVAISHDKGCYTGQEVIARQITYDKVTRRLVGLRLEAPVTPGAPVLAQGKAVGTVTSAVVSPHYGPIALAFVKRPYNEPGTTVTVAGEASSLSAVVTPLPFQGPQ